MNKKKIPAVGGKKEKTITTKEKFVAGARVTGRFLVHALGVVLSIILLLFIYVNLPVSPSKNNVQIGVTFSERYAQEIGLDWRAAYLAMLDDLNMKIIRIPVYWDSVEPSDGQYDFADLDWELQQAKLRNAKVILVVGEKVPRWPECYIPDWVGGKDAPEMKDKLLAFEQTVVDRYKDNHPEVSNWQVENEPFLNFGVCGAVDPNLLDSEISEVKSIDPSRPIVITDSGELSLWLKAASRADIFGTTMYREVYSAKMGHWRYPIGPNFFILKQLIIKLFAHQNNAIVIELQGEPWVQGWTTSAPVETQLASMNAATLVDNVAFAKETGMKEVYVWGVEWWYWMKVNQNNPTLWDAAKTLNQ